MSNLSYTILACLLVARVAIDLLSLSKTKFSRYFDLAYFVIFLIAGITLLLTQSAAVFIILAFVLAAFSLIQFIIKQKRHAHANIISNT